MCGRFGFFELKYFIEQLRQYEIPFGDKKALNFTPSYNITPETNIVMLQCNNGRYTLKLGRWGLIPHWVKGMPKVRPINARTETLEIKSYFRHMLNRTHCLIPASGFYEWKAEGLNKKQPYYIHRADGKPMAFAGLWDSWQAQEINELPIVSCAIVTTASNHEMKFVHDRMPIILEPEQWKSWLNADVTDTRKLLVPSKDGALALYPVSTQVNNPKYISHDCIKQLNVKQKGNIER
ncbi:MAG: SOS response-associated peptidase [Chlorobium sp.]|nr:MAG: SOS response-associated peptidase [Chlorobium sp.]